MTVAKKLSFTYKVHRGSQHMFSLPAKLADGTVVDANVNGFEAELVDPNGVHGTIRWTFPGGSEDAEALLREGATVKVSVG